MLRVKILCVFGMLSLLLTGCDSSGQVHEKNYLRAVSISGSDEKSVAFSFYSEEKNLLLSNGEDITDACEKAELKCGNSIFTGHTELVILGDCDYKETLELLLNEWKVSPSCVVVYGGAAASQLLEVNNASTLTDSVKKAIDKGKIPECDIVTVLSGLLSDEKSAQIALIGPDGADGSCEIKST